MATQAKITLSAQHGIVNPPQRILILNAAQPVALIGRASKSFTKGLFSAADNAWFDSPVMSRDHAQFSFRVEDKTITIEDIGSMHGTYLNGVELARNMPSTLNNGDVVVFGAEVRRGPETFPACGFQIAVEFSEPPNTGTFAFPESSDMEEDQNEGAEDDYDFSDDEHTGRQQQSSDDGASIESQPRNVQKFDDAIDLTRDDSPEESNRIDLTGETPSGLDTMEVLAARPKDIEHRAHSISNEILAGNVPILLDSDEDEEFDGASTDASELSEDEVSDSDNSDGSRGSSMHHDVIFPVSEESDAESEDMVIDDSYDVESAHGISEDEDQKISLPTVDSLTRYARAHDNSTILESDVRTRTQLPESVVDEDGEDDNGSEFGLSEAGEAGLIALLESDLRRELTAAASGMDKDSESESDSDSESDNEPGILVAKSSKENGDAKVQPPTTESLHPLTATAGMPTFRNFTDHTLGLSSLIVRQPSPSDAAMVKTATPSQQARTFPGVSGLGTFGQPTAQMLGNKTGKPEFFEAREANKARFGSEVKAGELALDTPSKPARPSSFGKSEPQIIVNGLASSSNLGNMKKATSNLNLSFPTREPCSFLDNPDQTRIPTRASSPQLDMTSAYSYNVSKNSALATASTPTNSRGIKIDDIIEPAIPRTFKLKRKADDISDVTKEEVRLWARASPTLNNTSKTTLEKPAIKAQPTTDVGITHPTPAAPTTIVTSEGRPTKRIRKMLENVGYAALGGVAVGAGLFTVLVATAPDFL